MKPPNLLRCPACEHTEELTAAHELPVACPSCGRWQRVRCGSPRRGRPGLLCHMLVKPGRRCNKLHGGKSPKGPASALWKTGEHSRYVPARYAAAFRSGMTDPLVQTSQRVQLAMLEGLQEEALKRLDTGESGEAWAALQASGKGIKRQLGEIKTAGSEEGGSRRAGELAQALLRQLEEEHLPLVERGTREEAAREELVSLYQKRARLIRVQQHGERTVPVEVLAVLHARFVSLMAKYVTETRDLTRLVAELREAAMPGWTGAELNPRLIAS